MVKPDNRTAVMTVRLSADERKALAALADADGISASDVLRMLVRRAHAERFPRGPRATRAERG